MPILSPGKYASDFATKIAINQEKESAELVEHILLKAEYTLDREYSEDIGHVYMNIYQKRELVQNIFKVVEEKLSKYGWFCELQPGAPESEPSIILIYREGYYPAQVLTQS